MTKETNPEEVVECATCHAGMLVEQRVQTIKDEDLKALRAVVIASLRDGKPLSCDNQTPTDFEDMPTKYLINLAACLAVEAILSLRKTTRENRVFSRRAGELTKAVLFEVSTAVVLCLANPDHPNASGDRREQ